MKCPGQICHRAILLGSSNIVYSWATQRLFLILEPRGFSDEQIIPCFPDLLPMAVVMILLPEQTRYGVTDFVPMIIVVVFSAEQAGHGIPNLMSFGIVKVRAAEESRMAFSDLLPMLVPVDRVAKQSFVACDLLCHDRTSLAGWKRGVMERLRSGERHSVRSGHEVRRGIRRPCHAGRPSGNDDAGPWEDGDSSSRPGRGIPNTEDGGTEKTGSGR